MIGRYVLKVSLGKTKIFDGAFTSLNKAIKFACGFHSDCSFFLYDYLKDKSYPSPYVATLCKEFEYVEILL